MEKIWRRVRVILIVYIEVYLSWGVDLVFFFMEILYVKSGVVVCEVWLYSRVVCEFKIRLWFFLFRFFFVSLGRFLFRFVERV